MYENDAALLSSTCSETFLLASLPSRTMASIPGTVILALWPDATNAAAQALKAEYKTQYPGADVILLHENSQIQPCIVREKVLVHLFGDYAAAQVCNLLRAHYSATGSVLDVSTVIFDEPPESAGWAFTLRPDYFLCSAFSLALSCLSWIVDEPPYHSSTWAQHDFQDSRLLPPLAKCHYAASAQIDHAREELLIGYGLVAY